MKSIQHNCHRSEAARKQINSRAGLLLLLLASMFNLQPPTAQAAAGDLDTTFAGTGKVRIGFGGGHAEGHAAAVQSDGKLILAGFGNVQYSSPGGDFMIARFGTNNVLDVSFGDGGRVVTPVSTNYPTDNSSVINALQVQADGKIVAAGYCYQKTNYTDFTLVRYNPDGSLDTAFGTNGTGIVYTDFGDYSQINAMVIQSDSNIVVAGFIGNRTGFALARYSINGVLDASFGSGGTVTTPGVHYAANAVMLQGDGKIVAVGTGYVSADLSDDFAVFRYTTAGVLDATFGNSGKVFTRISSLTYDHSANAVGWQIGKTFAGDRIVVAGTYDSNTTGHPYSQAVMRYNLAGSLDIGFGNGGIVTNDIIPQGVFGRFGQFGVGLIAQGQINEPTTVGGWVSDGTSYYYYLARYTGSGALDTTFGANSSGIITLPLGAAACALVQQSREFVLAGYQGISGGEYDFAAVRFTSSGLVDTTFGSNGLLLANISDAPGGQANAVAIQPDGKVVVAGSSLPFYQPVDERGEQRFALARFNPDGSLDYSFGSNGKLTTIIGSNDLAYAVAIQPDGKIVAAGTSYTSGQNQFALARYNANGSLDTLFGNGGTATVLLGTGNDQANAVKIQADGKIIAAGYVPDSTGYRHFALARFNANGALDTSFGSGGTVITSFGSPSRDEAYGAGIQPDGRIVVAGLTLQFSASGVSGDLAAARYNTNGALDFSFGSVGRTTANAGGGTLDAAYAMVIQPDGKIVVAGSAGLGNLTGPGNPSGNSFVALARFKTNGTLDTFFGSSGTVITEVGAYSDYAAALALQPDGKIVVAGASQNGFYQFFAQRYNSDGSVDNSYGNSGAALVDFGTGTNEFAYGLALDSSGRAVIVGDAGGFFGVTRLEGDSPANPLLRIFLTTSNTVVISWPYPSTGWNLQQNDSLSTASWVTPPETVNHDGTNNFIIASHSAARRFYRLQK